MTLREIPTHNTVTELRTMRDQRIRSTVLSYNVLNPRCSKGNLEACQNACRTIRTQYAKLYLDLRVARGV